MGWRWNSCADRSSSFRRSAVGWGERSEPQHGRILTSRTVGVRLWLTPTYVQGRNAGKEETEGPRPTGVSRGPPLVPGHRDRRVTARVAIGGDGFELGR